MDKNAIKTFAVESRRKMIKSVKFQASLLGISADEIKEPISKALYWESDIFVFTFISLMGSRPDCDFRNSTAVFKLMLRIVSALLSLIPILPIRFYNAKIIK